jgi:hypothetical protein
MLSQLDQDEAFRIMVKRYYELKPHEVINLCEGGLKSCPSIVCSIKDRKVKVLKLTEAQAERIVEHFKADAEEVELPESCNVPPEKMIFWNVLKRQP